MKVLTTEQQQDLLNLFEELQRSGALEVTVNREVVNQIAYWTTELKPKRVRRLPKENTDRS